MSSAEIVDHLRPFSREEVASFTAGCATRLEPIAVSLSRSDRSHEYAAWIEELWLIGSMRDAVRAQDLASRIGAAPEAEVDDSNRPEFYVMRSLSVVAYAVQVLLDEDTLRPAVWCSRGSISFLRDLDYVLGIPPESEGSLENLETTAQVDWILQLKGGAIGMEGEGGLANARASAVAQRLREVLPRIAQLRQWPMPTG